MRILISILPILIFLAMLVIVDVQKLIRFRILIYCFLYGIFISALSYVLGGFIYNQIILIQGLNSAYFSLLVVPIMEESLKIFLIIILIRKQVLHNPLTALFSGIAIGLGFSIVGNIFMLKSMQNIGTVFLILRGISTAFNQGLLTGITSLLIIQFSQKFGFKLLRSFVSAVLVASLLHSISNYLFANIILSLFVNILFLLITIFLIMKIETKKIGE